MNTVFQAAPRGWERDSVTGQLRRPLVDRKCHAMAEEWLDGRVNSDDPTTEDAVWDLASAIQVAVENWDEDNADLLTDTE